MKSRILKIAACAATAAIAAVSCDTDVRGSLYEGDGRQEYSFAAPSLHIELSDEDGTFSIPVYRSACDGMAEVKVGFESVSDGAGDLFALESGTVTFTDGRNEAEILVSCKEITKLELGQVYSFNLSFNGAEASPAGISTVEVTVKRNLVYEVVGKAKYHSSFFKTPGTGMPFVNEVTVERARGANSFRLLDVFVTGYPIEFSFDRNDNIIEFNSFATGISDSNYGDLSFRYEPGTFRREGNVCYFTLRLFSAVYDHDWSYDYVELPEGAILTL